MAFSVVVRRLTALTQDAAAGAKKGTAVGERQPGDLALATGSAEAIATALASTLAELDGESAFKAWLLAIAGAEGRDIAAVSAANPWKPSEDGPARRALSAYGAALPENLRRGAAIACATGFDLDLPIQKWSDAQQQDLEARAWLSFGKQLASSRPDDWQCFALAEARASQQLTKLYLRLADHQWWSFGHLLDRPSASVVERERKRVRPVGAASTSLAPMATRSFSTSAHALTRALRAIWARLGLVSDAAASGSKVVGRGAKRPRAETAKAI